MRFQDTKHSPSQNLHKGGSIQPHFHVPLLMPVTAGPLLLQPSALFLSGLTPRPVRNAGLVSQGAWGLSGHVAMSAFDSGRGCSLRRSSPTVHAGRLRITQMRAHPGGGLLPKKLRRCFRGYALVRAFRRPSFVCTGGEGGTRHALRVGLRLVE